MLIDLEELAGNIASKVDGARLTPVIEKEIVHYEIIRSLGRNDLLRDITVLPPRDTGTIWSTWSFTPSSRPRPQRTQ